LKRSSEKAAMLGLRIPVKLQANRSEAAWICGLMRSAAAKSHGKQGNKNECGERKTAALSQS
jgi:hypothetical protein